MVADLNTKANRRRLRELAGVAYSRELATELSKVEADFAKWRSGEIDPFELSDRIHRFHNGISRDLYVTYRDLSPHHSVARAVAYGILEGTEIPPEILAALGSAIEFFEQQREERSEQVEED
ncbi:MAG TPA: hypothetical protein VGX68_02190 [Thermoanaerobaculia bacterium]|nr:hypothetical protein [Thermoanaerobaculia bacterium]